MDRALKILRRRGHESTGWLKKLPIMTVGDIGANQEETMIIKKFEEQVEKFSEKLAVITDRKKLTYEELNKYANRVAHAILEIDGKESTVPLEKGKRQVVGLLFEHSADMIVGVLGTLKAGKIYVPLDITYPENRLAYMLADSDTYLVLTNHNNWNLAERLAVKIKNNLKIINIDAIDIKGNLSSGNVKRYPAGEKLAYILYTSGSTGKPKGVLQNHENVCYYIRNWTGSFSITQADRMTLFSAFSHDGAGQDMFGALFNGATLYPYNILNRANITKLAEWLLREKITIWHSVPTLYRYFVDTLKEKDMGKEKEQSLFPDLRFILLGGEQVRDHDIEMFKGFFPNAIFANVYGQTESSVDSIWLVRPGDSINKMLIGTPLDNTKILLVNKDDEIIEDIGVGEIYVSCPHIALGYWHDNENRGDVFTDDPDLGRLYRTGDLGRLMADGSIEFLGREDSQVKIRGFRIGVGEIETVLLNHEAIKQAVVAAKVDKNGDDYLCAYIVPKVTPSMPGEESVFTISEIRKYLAMELPEHMIPSYFMELAELPLTPNGKVDRKRLPEPEPTRPKLGVTYVAPGTGIEKKISAVWKDVLNLDKVGIDDSFFDLGGTSLDIMKIMTKLYDVFQRDIPVLALFRYPTIRSFVEYLEKEDTNKTEPEERKTNRYKAKTSEIAVIGMSARFPGAKSIAEYWENLKNGVESISIFTDEELAAEGIGRSLLNNPAYIRAKGIIEALPYFDSAFFNYSPKEAQLMDPQLRVLHECSWEALEDAGYEPESYEGLIGLYAGNANNSYWVVLTHLNNISLADSGFLTNNYTTIVSYKLNLKGPSFVVQSACSTSLVAIHLGCQGLLKGECDIALAGGVSVVYPNRSGYMYREGMIFSSDGHCRTFDARAGGTVFCNGAGIVALKRLEDAIADGDNINAVIRGSGVNNDGRRKVGLASPSVEGQAELVRRVLHEAEVDPASISYIEAHGTGTILGDPVELEALKLAFNTNKRGYCRIGSAKTNVGHLNIAAGVAGFIKTVLSIKHKIIPPSLNYEIPNPKFDFENSPFFVNTGLTDWESDGCPLRAGVSAFGIGGTNAHAILEQPPEIEASSPGRFWKLILLSAVSDSALEEMTANLAAYLKENPDVNLADVAYTLQVGRKTCKLRKMVLCSQVNEAVRMLTPAEEPTRPEDGRAYTAILEDENTPVVFMFSGQGSQYVDMGRELYESEALFREEMDRCFAIFQEHMGYDIKEILYPHPASHDGGELAGSVQGSPPGKDGLDPDVDAGLASARERHDVNRTEIAQPVIFMVEYALAKSLLSWGITPYAMIGHSIGEYTAACLSGVFSLADALKLVALRGKLMQQMQPGSMLSVPLPEAEVLPLLDEEVELAAVNAPGLCVVSGPDEAVKCLADQLQEKGVQARILHTSHAFHSRSMEPMLQEFEKVVADVTLNRPQLPYISNLSGTWISVEEAADPGYYARHLRSPVRFAAGLTELLKEPNSIFIEVGPGRALSTFVRQHKEKKPQQLNLNLIRHAKEKVSDTYYLLSKIGWLWLNGKKIDWQGFHAGERRHRISLPTYPFQKQYYWLAGNPFKPDEDQPADIPAQVPFKRADIAEWFYMPVWKGSVLPAAKKPGKAETFNWLVFIDECGISTRLVERLQADGQNVVIVGRGSEFSEHSSDGYTYTVNPGSKKDYEALLGKCCNRGKNPHRIVHLWNITDETLDPEHQYLLQDQENGFYSLLYLAQAIGSQSLNEEIQLLVLSNRMQAVLGEDIAYPQKAMVIGAVQVIPREYPKIKCRSIDITIPEPGSPAEGKLNDLLFKELSADVEDTLVAYRENSRFVKTYEPHPIATAGIAAPRLKEKGVYLITGGLGGIGLVLSGYLAKTVKARLVLTGRTAMPPEGQWEEWLGSKGEQDAISRKIRKVRQLQDLGAEVLLLNADAADKKQMREGMNLIEKKFGKINGVIHSAGIADGALIQLRTKKMSEKVLAPKLRGTLILNEILNREELDFFILCSSMSAITAPVGQVAYSAANAFLDNFAHYKTLRDNIFTVSINWDAWQEVGMAVDALEQSAAAQDRTAAAVKEVPLDYPLIDRCEVKDAKQAVYISNLRVNNCWCLDEHRIMGKATLPGTAYLEMARAAFKHLTDDEIEKGAIELTEFSSLIPLVIEEDEVKEMRIVFKQDGGGYNYSFISRLKPREDGWVEHARGKASLLKPAEPKKYTIKEIEEKCNKKEIIYKFEDFTATPGAITFGPRWNNLRQAKVGEDQVLAFLELPEEFAADIESYKLHPAILDVGNPVLKRVEREMGIASGGGYLPIYYRQVKIRGDLPQKVLFHVTHAGENRPGAEILKYNVTIMDEQGLELVKIEEYTLKMVKAERQTADQFGEKSKGVSQSQRLGRLSRPLSFFTAPDSVSTGNKPRQAYQSDLLSDAILPDEGVEVFTRVLAGEGFSQVVVSTIDLPLRLQKRKKPAVAASRETLQENKPTGTRLSRPNLSAAYVAPRTHTENKIAEVWQEQLGIEKVGIDDDFFELGGDSLKAITLTGKVQKITNVEIPLTEFFNRPNVRLLAEHVSAAAGEEVLAAVEIAENREYYPLSSAQERIFISYQLAPLSTAYNLPTGINFADIDRERVESALLHMIRRHESLRSSFEIIDGNLVQRVHKEVDFKLQFYDLAQDGISKEELIANFVQPFDLQKAPLMRTTLVKTKEKKYLLLLDFHHIITDARSLLVIFIRDFTSLYGEEALPPLQFQYKDFALWQNWQQARPIMKKKENFWLEQFKDGVPVLNLPTDFERPADVQQNFAGDWVNFLLDAHELEAFKVMLREEEATLFMGLAAVYNILLYKLSDQEDIVIGTPVAGRDHPDLLPIMGMFVNMLVLRNFPTAEKTFSQFLNELKEKVLSALENQDYQYDDLVEKLGIDRHSGRNPLFDVSFTLQNVMEGPTPVTEKRGGGGILEVQTRAAKFDISLEVAEVGAGLLCKFEYKTGLFKRGTIERFVDYFKEIIAAVIKNKNFYLKDISITHDLLEPEHIVHEMEFKL